MKKLFCQRFIFKQYVSYIHKILKTIRFGKKDWKKDVFDGDFIYI